MKSKTTMRWWLIGVLVLLSAGLILHSAIAVRSRIGPDKLNVFALTHKVHSGEVVRGEDGKLEYASWAAPEEPARPEAAVSGSSNGGARLVSTSAAPVKPAAGKPRAKKTPVTTKITKPTAKKPASPQPATLKPAPKAPAASTTTVKKPAAKKPDASGAKKPAPKKPACPT